MTKLIIGLGNPDEQYQNTRHNVGFMFIDFLAKKIGTSEWDFNKNFNSLISKTPHQADPLTAKNRGGLGARQAKLKKTAVILVKPRTYVNKSGEVVKKIIENYKFKIVNLIVIQDDLDIPFGNTKISFDKNSGGHKGIESIMRALKTKKFYRLRIGLAAKSLQKARQQSDKKRDEFVRNYVLSKFSKKESEKLKEVFKEAHNKLVASW